jgi:hypothetical protein
MPCMHVYFYCIFPFTYEQDLFNLPTIILN